MRITSSAGHHYHLDVVTSISNMGDVIVAEAPVSDDAVSYTIDLAQLDFVRPANVAKFTIFAFTSLLGAGIFGSASDFLFAAGASIASMIFIHRRLNNVHYTVRYDREGAQCIFLHSKNKDIIMIKNSTEAVQYLQCIDYVQRLHDLLGEMKTSK